MSVYSRVELPTNQDFGHAEVALLNDPANYPVAEPQLPGMSEDDLREAASKDWDNDLYGIYGIDAYPLTVTALRNRFDGTYMGSTIHEPGGFIQAVLAMQRTLPTTEEYAATLARDGLIRADEAAGLPSEFSYRLLDTDEGADRARAYFKVFYLANVAVPELRTARLAADYASHKMTSGSREGSSRRANEALFRARGIEDSEMRLLMDSTTGKSAEQDRRLRGLGMPNDLIEQLASAPRAKGGLLPRFNSARKIADDALSSSSLDMQIAYRQFYGMKNLAGLATAHAVVEKQFDDRSLAFSSGAIGIGLADEHSIQPRLAPDAPFKSIFYDEKVVAALGVPEQLTALASLATFLMHESGLNGIPKHEYLAPHSDILGNHVVDMVTYNYRVWLDQRIEQEQTTNH